MNNTILYSIIAGLMAAIVVIGLANLVREPEIATDIARGAADAAERVADTVSFSGGDADDDDVEAGAGTAAPAQGGSEAGGATFTMADVAAHSTRADCYTVISGSVYNLTPFVSRHPGGASAISSICGVDGTATFSAQHGGERRPASELAALKIGVLAR